MNYDVTCEQMRHRSCNKKSINLIFFWPTINTNCFSSKTGMKYFWWYIKCSNENILNFLMKCHFTDFLQLSLSFHLSIQYISSPSSLALLSLYTVYLSLLHPSLFLDLYHYTVQVNSRLSPPPTIPCMSTFQLPLPSPLFCVQKSGLLHLHTHTHKIIRAP